MVRVQNRIALSAFLVSNVQEGSVDLSAFLGKIPAAVKTYGNRSVASGLNLNRMGGFSRLQCLQFFWLARFSNLSK